jgi:hypothetical protein
MDGLVYPAATMHLAPPLAVLLASAVPAQLLLRDIHPSAGSNPASFTDVDGTLYLAVERTKTPFSFSAALISTPVTHISSLTPYLQNPRRRRTSDSPPKDAWVAASTSSGRW